MVEREGLEVPGQPVELKQKRLFKPILDPHPYPQVEGTG